MTKLSLAHCIVVALALAAQAGPAWGGVAFDLGTSQAYTNNLFQDTNNIEDHYATANASLKVYPLSILELNGRTDYTLYRTNTELGNYAFGGSATFIPLSEEARFSLYVSAGVDKRSYGEVFETVNNVRSDLRTALGYRLSPQARLRCGVLYRIEDYPNFEAADKRSADLYAGTNLTFLGSNSFDLETGFSLGKVTYADTLYYEPFIWKDFISIRNVPVSDATPLESKENLHYFYISPRYSRPLGSATGLNITFQYRALGDLDESYVIGYSVETISPWASTWGGYSLTGSLKTYLLPHCVLTTGVGYWWHKKYFRALGENEHGGWRIPEDNRKDDQIRAYLSVQRPIVTAGGTSIQPNIRLEYTDNSSTDAVYEYTGLTVTASVNASF
jgi:hypothetical protein